MYQALYRKYRPQRFEDVVGQRHIIQTLKNAIDQIYRPNSQIGDGGLADAVRYELKTGKLVGGKSHIQKANERIKNLENIIRKENLNEKDLKIAKDILNDINMALKGK